MVKTKIETLIKAIESGEAIIGIMYKGNFYPLTEDELKTTDEQPEEVENVENPLCF